MAFFFCHANAQERANTLEKNQSVAKAQNIDPRQFLVTVKNSDGAEALGVSYVAGQNSQSKNEFTWVIGSQPAFKRNTDTTISFNGIVAKGEFKYFDEESGFFLILVDNTKITPPLKSKFEQPKSNAFYIEKNKKIDKQVATKLGSLKIAGTNLHKFTTTQITNASNLIFFDNSGNLLGISLGNQSKEPNLFAIDNTGIQRIFDAVMQTEFIKILTVNEKYHGDFGVDFVKWYMNGTPQDNERYFNLYKNASSILDGNQDDKLEKTFKAMSEIAQAYLSDKNKTRNNTAEVKKLNLVCNVFSRSRDNHRSLTFLIDSESSTVNGYPAIINENQITYEYSNQDGTRYKTNIDRTSGFVVIGTVQFPLLMSGNCIKTEGKAF